MNYLVVISTASSEKEGQKIAKKLVEARLAACVNVIPRVRSFFYWEGKLCEENEALLLIKTTKNQFRPLINKIKKIHSYAVPEIIGISLEGGERNYLNWVKKAVGRRE